MSLQIELYNSMVEKAGTDDAEAARNAFYHATRATQKKEEEETSPADHVSNALIEKVSITT